MKKVLLSVSVLALSTFGFAQAPAASGLKVADVAKFSAETIDMGKLKQGNPTKATFIVTNISKEPLIIEQANPTCGCTISDYTKEPIAPGKTGVINATYNAANAGHFDKHLTVKFHGVDEVKSIGLTGEVIANPTPAPSATPATTEKAKAAGTDDKPKAAEVKAAPAAAPAATPAKATKAKKTAKKAPATTEKKGA